MVRPLTPPDAFARVKRARAPTSAPPYSSAHPRPPTFTDVGVIPPPGAVGAGDVVAGAVVCCADAAGTDSATSPSSAIATEEAARPRRGVTRARPRDVTHVPPWA